MRIIFLITIISLCLYAACGEESKNGVSPDGASSVPPDSAEIQAEHHASPQDTITGTYNLIDEAQSVTDEANARTEELEQLMGDM